MSPNCGDTEKAVIDMSGCVNNTEQYVSAKGGKVLLWKLSETTMNNEVQQRVLILRLSHEEYTNISARDKRMSIQEALQKASSTLVYPDVQLMHIVKSPYYASARVDFSVSSTEPFDNILQQMKDVVIDTGLAKEKA